MVYPVTSYVEYRANARQRVARIGSKQARPFTLKTNFTLDFREDLSESGPFNNWPGMASGVQVSYDSVRAAAYSRFVNELGNASQLGSTATAEAKSTCNLVTSKILEILRSARLAKQGRFMEAFRVLGYPVREKTIRKKLYYKNKKVGRVSRGKMRGGKYKVVVRRYYVHGNGREVAQTLAGGWLVWSYGINPLQQDIYNSLDLLQRPLPYFTNVRASARQERRYEVPIPTAVKYIHKLKVTMHARVSVVNPNLWMLNQQGLINPIQWINEAIPFSFVVDWFSNLSAVIGSWTDFTGLDMSDPCTIELLDQTEWQSWQAGYYDPMLEHRFHRVYRDRVYRPFLKPNLVFDWERVQWQRGLNAISLLVVVFGEKR